MRFAITGYPGEDSLAHNLFVTLQAMGHKVGFVEEHPWRIVERRLGRILGSLVLRRPGFELLRSQGIARQAARMRPDFFFSVWSWLRPEAVQMIRDAGVTTVLWYPDHIVNLGRQYPLVAPYHLLLFKDPYAVRLFREKLGIPVHYMPEACNPLWHKPVTLTEDDLRRYACDITTAGNMYPYRAQLLEIFNEGYELKLWGPPWPSWLSSPVKRFDQGVYLFQTEKAKAFTAARIVLNTMHYGEIEGVNCRTFEAAGCGAFQIADWKPALPDLFVPDKEIVTFGSREELKDKVDYYLHHPDQRRRIAQAGQIRAHHDHTYEDRIRRVLELVPRHA